MKKAVGFSAVLTAWVVLSACGGTTRDKVAGDSQSQQGIQKFGTAVELVSQVSQYQMPPGQPITREMAEQPIAIVTESLENPDSGPVRVWIQSEIQLAADPVLFWTATTGGFPGAASSGVYEIGAGFFPLNFTRIQVLRKGGDQQFPAIPGQWIEIPLGAGERVEVEYLIEVPQERLCSMPAVTSSAFTTYTPSLSRVAFQGIFRRHISVARPGEELSAYPKSIEVSLNQSRSFPPKHRWVNPRQLAGAPLGNGCVGFFPLY